MVNICKPVLKPGLVAKFFRKGQKGFDGIPTKSDASRERTISRKIIGQQSNDDSNVRHVDFRRASVGDQRLAA